MTQTTGEFDANIEDLVEHHEVELDGISMHYVSGGPEDGPPVVLLHGFPEFWFSWRNQIPALKVAGYRFVVPDQRGYNLTSKPTDVSEYTMDKLVGDVIGLLDALGLDDVVLVGHDWGGFVAWFTAMQHPDRIRKLAVLNMPHPVQMRRGMRTFKQLRKSWYIGAFQLPFVPEKTLAANDYAIFRSIFREQPVSDRAYDEQEVDALVEAFAREGAATATINWYRAARSFDWDAMLRPIELPTLVIFGTQDAALNHELADPPAEWVTDARVERIPDASHWVQSDTPDKVNRLLLHFMAES